MIKDLIKEIANDNISLSQALIRSKIIAFKINNNVLKEWIKKEIEGYDYDDELLPDYRKVYSELELTAHFTGGTSSIIPFGIPKDLPQNIVDSIYHHQIRESILIVELQIAENIKPENATITLPDQMMEVIKSTLPRALVMQVQMTGGLFKLQRQINTANHYNVINQTKNKLLDILLELENEFPDLENDYVMNDKEIERAQNIITTNIYGSAVPVNITTGNNNNNEQTVNYSLSAVDYEKLMSLNVEKKDIDDLNVILQDSQKDKSKLPGKIIGWLTSVGSSLTARGLYDFMPQISEYVQSVIS